MTKEEFKSGDKFEYNGKTYIVHDNKDGHECIMLNNLYRCWIQCHGGTCPLNCKEQYLWYE